MLANESGERPEKLRKQKNRTMNSKRERKLKRIGRIRKNIFGTPVKPRVALSRTNKYMFAQVIDDTQKKTLVGVSDRGLMKTTDNIARATKLGNELGKKMKTLKITTGVFDRRGNAYHGRVKAFVEAVKSSGITI